MALIDETHKKMDSITGEELLRRLQKVKQSYNSIRKGIRFAGNKQKPLNITTPHMYEKAELIKYQAEIKKLENAYKDIKHKEEEEKAAFY